MKRLVCSAPTGLRFDDAWFFAQDVVRSGLRRDCEHGFDELKNQWGWGGFTTQDMDRSQITATGSGSVCSSVASLSAVTHTISGPAAMGVGSQSGRAESAKSGRISGYDSRMI